MSKDDVVIQPQNIVIPITKWFQPSTKTIKKGKK